MHVSHGSQVYLGSFGSFTSAIFGDVERALDVFLPFKNLLNDEKNINKVNSYDFVAIITPTQT